MSEVIIIPRRFNGPPDSGHGGYVAGVVADLVGNDQPVEVTLRKPPPLEMALPVDRTGDHVYVRDGAGDVIAEGVQALLDLAVPELPSPDAVDRAAALSSRLQPGANFETCVACGPKREKGDGLRIFAGPVHGRDMVAAPWRPDSSLSDDGTTIAARYIWTALDCPSYAAIEPGRESLPALLGRICGSVARPLRAGERTTIVGWRIAEDGRKRISASALFSESGELCAFARMTWVVLARR